MASTSTILPNHLGMTRSPIDDTSPSTYGEGLDQISEEMESTSLHRRSSQASNSSGGLGRRGSQSSNGGSSLRRLSRSQGGGDTDSNISGGLFRRLSKKARSSISHSFRPRTSSFSAETYTIDHPSLENFFSYLYGPPLPPPWTIPDDTPTPPAQILTPEEKERLPRYRLLESEGELSQLLSKAEGYIPRAAWKGLKEVSVISFQPAAMETSPNEDRYSVNSFDISSHGITSQAQLLIVYDGHAGHLAVDHVHSLLPSFLINRLQPLLSGNSPPSATEVSAILTRAFQEFDAEFLANLTDLLPPWEEVEKLNDKEINELMLKDGGKVNEWAVKVATGACAVVGLIVGKDIWVAGLGDSEAVLGIKDPVTSNWRSEQMAYIQNCSTPSEREKFLSEHPNEPNVYLNGRYCGLIICTRAFGDAWMKLPATFATKIFPNTNPANRSAEKILTVAKDRFLTPPYISSTPEVKHYKLPENLPPGHAALLLCSDGFRDMPFPRSQGSSSLEADWITVLGELLDSGEDEIGGNGTAAQLLRKSWERKDLHLASAFTTLPIKALDDTTVLVAVL